MIRKGGDWTISSITSKSFLSVTGDGVSSLATLIAKDAKASKFKKLSSSELDLDCVPPEDEHVILEPIGNHSRGTDFVNECCKINRNLNTMFSRELTGLKGVRYCRIDIRAKSWADVERGDFKLMEINGVSAEPGHIYDPNTSLKQAYQDLLFHWSEMSKIAGEELKKGERIERLGETVRFVKNHLKMKKELHQMQKEVVDVLGCSGLDLNQDAETIMNSICVQTVIKDCDNFEKREGYNRSTLYQNKDIEIVFCQWLPGGKTPVHLHPGLDCSFKCIGGEIMEIRSMGQEQNLLKEDIFGHIDDSKGAHQMVNLSNDCAYTLHVYRKSFNS